MITSQTSNIVLQTISHDTLGLDNGSFAEKALIDSFQRNAPHGVDNYLLFWQLCETIKSIPQDADLSTDAIPAIVDQFIRDFHTQTIMGVKPNMYTKRFITTSWYS